MQTADSLFVLLPCFCCHAFVPNILPDYRWLRMLRFAGQGQGTDNHILAVDTRTQKPIVSPRPQVRVWRCRVGHLPEVEAVVVGKGCRGVTEHVDELIPSHPAISDQVR